MLGLALLGLALLGLALLHGRSGAAVEGLAKRLLLALLSASGDREACYTC